jgi:glycosyltransferase involved in cell wall biosynthesis
MNTSKHLRILHVTDYFYPQLGYQETFLPKVETEQGYNVYVLTSNLYDKTIYEVNKGILGQKKTKVGQSIERGIKTIRLPAFHLPILNKLYLLGLEEVIAKLKPDVIICHDIVILTSIRVARLIRRLPEVKLIFDDHMTYNATRGGIFYFIYFLFSVFFTHLILKSADGLVAVTNETKKFMEKIYRIPGERIKIIPLGVDTKLFQQNISSREKIRGEYDIYEDDVVFIYAGKVILEKSPHLLVEAAVQILRKYSNIKVMFVGGSRPDYADLLKKEIKYAGFESHFKFISAVPNDKLYEYYSAADVGVWPLQCSLAMLEAMACGLPVIISDHSGALERISEGNGLMYREGDVNDLAEKIKIMLNSKLRKNMSLRAREFAEKNDWNVISKKLLELIEI